MSVRVLAITQARTGSTRLPGKVLKMVDGKTVLQVHLERLRRSRLIDRVVVATTVEPRDHLIAEHASLLGFGWYKGSEADVLDRYYRAAQEHAPEYVVRVTSDCPLIDPDLVDHVVTAAIDSEVDYASNTVNRTYPVGTDTEVVRFTALERAWREATERPHREHVTPYIINNAGSAGRALFTATQVMSSTNYSQFRLTIDYPEDFELFTALIRQLGSHHGWKTYTDHLIENQDLYALNRQFGLRGSGKD